MSCPVPEPPVGSAPASGPWTDVLLEEPAELELHHQVPSSPTNPLCFCSFQTSPHFRRRRKPYLDILWTKVSSSLLLHESRRWFSQRDPRTCRRPSDSWVGSCCPAPGGLQKGPLAQLTPLLTCRQLGVSTATGVRSQSSGAAPPGCWGHLWLLVPGVWSCCSGYFWPPGHAPWLIWARRSQQPRQPRSPKNSSRGIVAMATDVCLWRAGMVAAESRFGLGGRSDQKSLVRAEAVPVGEGRTPRGGPDLRPPVGNRLVFELAAVTWPPGVPWCPFGSAPTINGIAGSVRQIPG